MSSESKVEIAAPTAVAEVTDKKTSPSRKVALITGITGQDGSYLAELLLEKGYIVHGLIRRSSSFNTGRIEHLYADRHDKSDLRFFLHYGDLLDYHSVESIVRKVEPHEVYHLAAQSHVKVSFELAEYTSNCDALGTLRILEAIRHSKLPHPVRFYQASTSELFGKVREIPQTETTPFHPRSPYGVAKQFAYWIVVNYREAYGMHASNGILFNHESPRRGVPFVTRKITMAAAKIARGQQECLYLGNLDAKRDWGHARDFVYAMWQILQHDKPDDFVVSTGENHSVREFAEKAFRHVGLTIAWEGKGVDEIGRDQHGKIRVRIDPAYFRPAEVDQLLGDPSKAKRELKWTPKVTFDELVKEMVEADLCVVDGKPLPGTRP